MARDTPVGAVGGADSDDSRGRESDLGRRSYLRRAGTASAALLAAGAASAPAAADDHGRAFAIDYDAYGDPSEVYDINDIRCPHTPEFVTDRSVAGECSLYTDFAGGQKTANLEYRFPEHGLGLQEEVYTKFSVYPENFDLAPEDTIRIFWAPLTNGPGSSGGGATDGTNGWSNAIGFANREGAPAPDGYKFFSYCYHMDNSGSGDFQMTDAVVRMDEWNEIECYVKVNSVDGGEANADGVMQYWVNGELAFEETSMRFTTTEENHIEAVGPLGYAIGNGGALYYDEHAICLGMDCASARSALE